MRRRGSTWTYVIDVGRDPGSGKRRQKTKGGFTTKKRAESAMRDALARVDVGATVAPSKQQLGPFLTEWLEAARPTLRPSTQHGYAKAVRYAAKVLGAMRLQDLTPKQLEEAYSRLTSEGGKHGQGLAPKTVHNVHTVLRRALSTAERDGLVFRNVAAIARPPRVERAPIATWTAAELARFLLHVRDDAQYCAYLVLATTRMRRGEVLGLRWADIDLDGSTASVRQTVTSVAGEIVIGEPKTARSRRQIALDADTVAALAEHKSAQVAGRTRTEGDLQNLDLVFCEVDGRAIDPDSFSRRFARRAASAGLPSIKGPHGLRHTWATLALEAGVHPKVVSDRLGHASTVITLDIYSHVAPSLDADAASTVARAIRSSTTEVVPS